MSRTSMPPLEDDFARALLGSAAADAPSRAAYAKAAAALGVGVGLGVGAALPAAAVGTAGIAHAARWTTSLSAKLWLLGVSGALLGAGALLLVSPAPVTPKAHGGPAAARQGLTQRAPQAALAAPAPSVPERKSAAAVPSVPATAKGSAVVGGPAALPGVPEVRSVLPSAPAVPHPLPVAPATRRVGRAVPAPVPPPARASSDSSLAEQVQSLDRARVALAAGDASSALAEIGHYRAAWPDGVFLTEASVLEIEALAARGERGRAATRAADFVATHPDSPQADRLRSLISRTKR